MRRKDREIVDPTRIIEVMRQCRVCHVAFFDEEFPYIVPLNFGLSEKDGQVVLYFHGAKTGHKHDLLLRNNRVSFSMVVPHGIVTGPRVGACECTMEFESVCGTGVMEYVPEEEKIPALRTMLEHYHVVEGEEYHFHEEVVPFLAVLKLTVLSMTGKKRSVEKS